MISFSARQGLKSAIGPVSAYLSASSISMIAVSEKSTASYAHNYCGRRWIRTVADVTQKHRLQSSMKTTFNQHHQTTHRSASFVAWYEQRLQAHPVFTKMFTGSVLWGLGDAVAQIVPQLSNDDDDNGNKEFEYDLARTGRATIFGFAIHAPLSHLHFNFLEYMTVRANVTGLGIPVFKAFMEQFVYWSWFSNSLYHGAMGAMQGQSLQQMYDRIADVLWETQLAQWKFWIPIQLLNFQFTPVRHQLNVVLVTSIAWTALLSAWYPPQEKKDEDPEANNDQ